MNVLVINGSPRGENSNTMKLTRTFLAGAGWENAEVIDAGEDIRACKGCFACWSKTPGVCVIKDRMAEILPKIIEADVLIWSFPLYYFSVPGALKNLIDRQLPLSMPTMKAGSKSGAHPPRYDVSKRKNIVISTCGFWTAQDNYDGVLSMFKHMYGKKYTHIFCGQGEIFRIAEMKGDADNSISGNPIFSDVKKRAAEYIKTVRQAGAEFAGAGEFSAGTTEKLSETLLPQDVFEDSANASW